MKSNYFNNMFKINKIIKYKINNKNKINIIYQ